MRDADDNAPFAALAFKIMADPFVGKLTYFRVYSGKLDGGRRASSTCPPAAPSASGAS